MFRVPLDTVLRRASVASLLVLATALSACGDDTSSKADTSDGQSALSVPGGDVSQAPEGTSPSTPDGTTPAKAEETDEVLPGGVKAVKISPEMAKNIGDRIQDRSTIARASAKKKSESALKTEIASAKKALSAVTGKKIETMPPGEAGSKAQIIAGDVRILFFDSNRAATEATRNYQQLIATRPGFGRADVHGSRMWLLTVATKVKPADITKFRKAQDTVEAKL